MPRMHYTYMSIIYFKSYWVFGYMLYMLKVVSLLRVQREQLAAIFRLLKDNKETFGEVSEGDLEDQFRLYSI